MSAELSPASCAYRITMSPHEWEWSQTDQEAMARHIVQMDRAMGDLKASLTELRDLWRRWPKVSADEMQNACKYADRLLESRTGPEQSRRDLEQRVRELRGDVTILRAAVSHYRFHDCLTTEQQQVGATALKQTEDAV